MRTVRSIDKWMAMIDWRTEARGWLVAYLEMLLVFLVHTAEKRFYPKRQEKVGVTFGEDFLKEKFVKIFFCNFVIKVLTPQIKRILMLK